MTPRGWPRAAASSTMTRRKKRKEREGKHPKEARMVRLTVNGRSVSVDVDPGTLLVYVLRNDLALNGPKLGCGSGLCGACTVHVEGRAVRSCQTPVSAV